MDEKIKQKKGSAAVIILIVVLLLLVVLGVVAYFVTQKTNLINFNFSSKSKFIGAFSDVGDKISENSKEATNVADKKIYTKMEGKPVEYSLEATANIDALDIPSLTSTEVKSIKGVVNDSQLKLNLKADTEKNKMYGDLELDGTELGEVVYNSEAMALKVPSIDSKYYTIFKNSLKGTAYESLTEVFDYIDNFGTSSLNLDDFKFTSEEVNHFSDVYSKIFEGYATDDKLSTEKTEITIDGNNKSCEKITLALNSKEASELVSKYVEAFKNDTEGRNMLISKYIKMMKATNTYDMMLEEMGYTDKEFKTELEDSFDTMIESMEDMVQEIKDNDTIKYKIIVYADMFKTYRIEMSMSDEDNEIKATMNLKDDGVYTEITADTNGEVIKMNINMTKNNMLLSVETEDDIKMEIELKQENKDITLTMNMKYMGDSILDLTIKSTEESSTDKELNTTSSINIKFDYDNVKVAGTINLKENLKIVDSIDIPEVTEFNSNDVVKNKMLDQVLSSFVQVLNIRKNSVSAMDNAIESMQKQSDYLNTMYDTNTAYNTNAIYNTNTSYNTTNSTSSNANTMYSTNSLNVQ